MKILVTGDYSPEYNRTSILLAGLKEINTIEVKELPFSSYRNKELIKEEGNNADIIYLPPFTHKDVKFIKKLTSSPILFDPLISKYLTKVFDYKLVSKYSPRAQKNYFKDLIPLNISNHIISDTFEHKLYYSRKFKIEESKISVLPIGVNTSLFKPVKKHDDEKFIVGFYGFFNPLQGTPIIIEIAKLLKDHEDIIFEIIGEGFEYHKMIKQISNHKLHNIKLHGILPYDKLNQEINRFDICLGIFGNTLKADLVIPNKIYHYAACNKCIITKETPAIKEIFTNEKDIILTAINPGNIAETILRLQKDKDYREKIANNGYKLIKDKYNHIEIAKKFHEIVLQNF